MAQHWIPLTIFIWGERMRLGGFPWLGIHNVAATSREGDTLPWAHASCCTTIWRQCNATQKIMQNVVAVHQKFRIPVRMNSAIISIDSPLKHTRFITIKANFSNSPVKHNKEIMNDDLLQWDSKLLIAAYGQTHATLTPEWICWMTIT